MENNFKVIASFLKNYDKLHSKYEVKAVRLYAEYNGCKDKEEKDALFQELCDTNLLRANLENERKVFAKEFGETFKKVQASFDKKADEENYSYFYSIEEAGGGASLDYYFSPTFKEVKEVKFLADGEEITSYLELSDLEDEKAFPGAMEALQARFPDLLKKEASLKKEAETYEQMQEKLKGQQEELESKGPSKGGFAEKDVKYWTCPDCGEPEVKQISKTERVCENCGYGDNFETELDIVIDASLDKKAGEKTIRVPLKKGTLVRVPDINGEELGKISSHFTINKDSLKGIAYPGEDTGITNKHMGEIAYWVDFDGSDVWALREQIEVVNDKKEASLDKKADLEVFTQAAVDKGVKIEMENGVASETLAKEVATDNLKQDPNFYDKLTSFGG